MEKKDLLEPELRAAPPLRSGSSSLAEINTGLYRMGQAMGEGERVWSPIICDHQMERLGTPG
jgi:hypothetical protein